MRRLFASLLLLTASAGLASATAGNKATYTVSDRGGPGRVLDGIGGLSGGGATSVLLWTYPEPQRSEILDYLFKPNFGANLQILKVEIGGDAQSTDGAESSHMHTPDIEDYKTGYEWWLMVEAKKRAGSNLTLYGLPWAFPQWVTCSDGLTNCSNNIYSSDSVIQRTATYVTKWVVGARVNYGLEIDFLGIWNERPWNNTYIRVLRRTLDRAGCQSTKLVVPDGFGAGFAEDLKAHPSLAADLYAIGQHYPGTMSSLDAVTSGKQIWASEDDSTYNNDVGAGCLARIINENYVNGNMSATINWNLIASYQKGTNWYRAGLMTAQTPWPGKASYGSWHFDGTWSVGPMIWVVAHTTQFTKAKSWNYLVNQSGSGHLRYGGSYVTLQDFETGDFTIVVEKMTRDHSSCVRPTLPFYSVESEEVTFQLDMVSDHHHEQRGAATTAAAAATSLQLWETHFVYSDSDPEPRREFQYAGEVPISATTNTVTFNATTNSLYTLTTVTTGHKGSHGVPSAHPSLFPRSHTDDFEDCRISGEGRYFTDQNGIFQCTQSADPQRGVVMQQQVPLRPVTWGHDIRPHSLIGHRDLMNISLNIDGYITEPGASVMLGVRMQGTDNSAGILFAIDSNGNWGVWTSVKEVSRDHTQNSVLSGTLPYNKGQPHIAPGEWHTFRIDANGTSTTSQKLNVWIDGVAVISNFDVSGDNSFSQSGFGLIGTKFYAEYTQYDAFAIYSDTRAPSTDSPKVGSKICIVEPNSEVGPVNTSSWKFDAWPNNRTSSGGSAPAGTSTISLREWPTLCVRANSSQAAQRRDYSDHLSPSRRSTDQILDEIKRMYTKEGVRTVKSSTTAAADHLAAPRRRRSFKTRESAQKNVRSEIEEPWWLELATCDSSDPYQNWAWHFGGVAPDSERQSFIHLPEFGVCLDIFNQKAHIGAQMDAWSCNLGENQAFFYDYSAGEIANEATATVLGVCKD